MGLPCRSWRVAAMVAILWLVTSSAWDGVVTMPVACLGDARQFLGPADGAQEATARAVIDFRGGLLTVKLRHTPWEVVIAALEHQAGIRIRVAGALPGTLTQAFEALPLEQGLRRLFRAANVLFVYAAEGPTGAAAAVLRDVWVVPREGSLGEARLLIPTAEGTSPPAHSGEEDPILESASTAVPDQEERLLGLHALAQQNDVTALQQAIFDPDQTIQAAAIELLAAWDPQGTVAALVDATTRASPEQRLQALHFLMTQAEAHTVLETLGQALGDAEVTVKSYAIQALPEWGGPEAWGLLREALQDPDPAVRLRVLENSVSHPEGRPLLEEALADADVEVRAVAAYWLEQVLPDAR